MDAVREVKRLAEQGISTNQALVNVGINWNSYNRYQSKVRTNTHLIGVYKKSTQENDTSLQVSEIVVLKDRIKVLEKYILEMTLKGIL